MSARIVLLVTSPRLPAGLLTAAAWDTLRAHPVFAAAESEQAAALRSSGVPVTIIESDPERLLAELADMQARERDGKTGERNGQASEGQAGKGDSEGERDDRAGESDGRAGEGDGQAGE